MKLLLFLILVIIGCSNSESQKPNKSNDDNVNKMLEQLNKDYNEVKVFFNEDFVSHFPDKVDTNVLRLSDCTSKESAKYDLINLFLTNRIPEEKLEMTIKMFEKKSNMIYKASDTCLLVVNRFVNEERFGMDFVLDSHELKKISKKCYDNKLPVPNFWGSKFVTLETECKISKDFKIYVFDAKQGKFLEDKYLTTGEYMPKSWKNGFSKGVAISQEKKIIIYWVIIW